MLPDSPVSFVVLPKLAQHSQHPVYSCLLSLMYMRRNLWKFCADTCSLGLCMLVQLMLVQVSSASCGLFCHFYLLGYQIKRCDGNFFSKTQDCWEYCISDLVLRKLELH